MGEDSNTITYEQFLKEANLRDFTKKNNLIPLNHISWTKTVISLKR